MSVDNRVTIETPAASAYARTLTTAVEALALGRGLARRESMRFELTVEELFLCLADMAKTGAAITTTLAAKRRLLRVSFAFEADSLTLGALNAAVCAPVCLEDGPPLELGLLLAGKVADRFHIELAGKNKVLVAAEVDRVYPPAPELVLPAGLRPPFAVRPASDAGQLAQAAALAVAAYPAWHCPQSFRTPGKFTDMVADGDAACVMAWDAAGQPAGLLAWTPCSDRGLFFSGPFVFAAGDAAGVVARLLVEGFVAAVARERYDMVLSLRATPDVPAGAFESLGSLDLWRDGCRCPQPVLFRHLREDAGMAVWSRPSLEAFLRQGYDRLAMARDILPAEPPTGRLSRESLLGADFDRQKNLGELRPLLDGQDMADNLARHVSSLRQQGIANILFYMDISRSWEAALADDLAQAGFSPKVILPHGGRGDMVVWQHDSPA